VNERLGQVFVRGKLISDEQLIEAIKEAKLGGEGLMAAIAKLGYATEDTMVQFLSKISRRPLVELSSFDPPSETLALIKPEIVRKYTLIPFARQGSTLVVATADPYNLAALDDLKFATGFNIQVVLAKEGEINATISRLYGDQNALLDDVVAELGAEDVQVVDTTQEFSVDELARATDQAPVVKITQFILLDAIKRGASDIHIEPYEKVLRVRYRIDGVMHEMIRPPLQLKDGIISRIKILAKLDISERRLPQDGRIKLKISAKKTVDFRVSILPTLFGEKAVLRLLDPSNLMLDMAKLGYDPEPLAYLQKAIHEPYGMVLVTGPTGSGKTVALYSALSELNSPDVNISTAEDPVEFNFMGINQVNVHADIGLTFSAALRSFLRQDPDIILIGEIRDLETAEIGVKAALTGHMVLSTLHTNDAPSTITRLQNMGIESFLVASAVNLITAQRLGRRICSECKELVEIPAAALINAGVKEDEVEAFKAWHGKGCPRCNGTGYKGRVGFYQVMPMFPQIREAVLRGANADEIGKISQSLGIPTLRQAALRKVTEGVTTLEEALRVTLADD